MIKDKRPFAGGKEDVYIYDRDHHAGRLSVDPLERGAAICHPWHDHSVGKDRSGVCHVLQGKTGFPAVPMLGWAAADGHHYSHREFCLYIFCNRVFTKPGGNLFWRAFCFSCGSGGCLSLRDIPDAGCREINGSDGKKINENGGNEI